MSLHEGNYNSQRMIYVVNVIVGIRKPTKHIKPHKELTEHGHKPVYVCIHVQQILIQYGTYHLTGIMMSLRNRV